MTFPLTIILVFSKTLDLFPDICKQIIELILDIKVNHIDFPERENVIEFRTDSKGIRLDVYVEDDVNRSFDLEMQIANSDNISKRMRYYQGLIDGDKLKHGQHYSALGDSYIIFICPFDRFKRGRHIYTFRERCDEDKNITLDDGSVKILLSTKGTLDDVSPEIKNFLNYVDNGTIAGDFVQKLDAAVLSVKSNQKVRKNFMTYQMALLESKLEGEEKGRLQGIESVAFNMIKKGKALETISELTELSIAHLKSLADKLKISHVPNK
jgi:predicted transposase/invertase (TIGR01784 family)